MLMVKAGNIVDDIMNRLITELDSADILIDIGNAFSRLYPQKS